MLLIVLLNITQLILKLGNYYGQKIILHHFNSQVKIYKDKFFVIDFENVLRCYSIKDGKEIWKIKTEKVFINLKKTFTAYC